MAVSARFTSFVLDQLEALGDVTGRSMFGGVGFYKGDLFFAIAARDVLYLKVDDQNAGMFVEAGMRPFKPFKGRSGTMRYYEVPLAVLESAPELVRWARMSVAVAARAEGGRGPKH